MVLASKVFLNREYRVILWDRPDNYQMYSGIPPEMRDSIVESDCKLTLEYIEHIPNAKCTYKYTIDERQVDKSNIDLNATDMMELAKLHVMNWYDSYKFEDDNTEIPVDEIQDGSIDFNLGVAEYLILELGALIILSVLFITL